MENKTRTELIEQIKELLSYEKEIIDINPALLNYFEDEDLESIHKGLLEAKKCSNQEFLDEIYEKTKE